MRLRQHPLRHGGACEGWGLVASAKAFMAARAMRSRHGMGCSRLRNAVLEGEGGFSGGTLASGLHALTTTQENDAMKDPYGLEPPGGQRGCDRCDGGETDLPRYDALNQRWLIMSPWPDMPSRDHLKLAFTYI